MAKELAELWDNGNLIGMGEVDYVDGIRVLASLKPKLMQMKADAKKEGVDLTIGAGLRTYKEQLNLRVQNIIDKSKAGDLEYLKTAPPSAFKPVTGKPGFSNHHDGKATDFNVTGKPKVYAWLVKNALKYGMVRTVKSKFDENGKLIQDGERWHWEDLPGVDKFYYVPKTDPTWDGLV